MPWQLKYTIDNMQFELSPNTWPAGLIDQDSELEFGFDWSSAGVTESTNSSLSESVSNGWSFQLVCSCTCSHFSKVERTSSSPFSTNHHLITITVPIYWLELTFGLYLLNAHRCQFVRVVMTAEAEVSLMVPQTFLAPSIGTLGLKRTMLGRTVLGSRCLRALRLVDTVLLVLSCMTSLFLWLSPISAPIF